MGLSSAFRILVRPVGWSIGVAAIAVSIIFLIGSWLGAPMEVTVGDEAITLGLWDFALFAAAAVAIGGMIAVLLLAWVPFAGWIFAAMAMLVFAVFLIPPFAGTDDGGTLITLIMAHIATLAPVLILIVPTMLAPPVDVDLTV